MACNAINITSPPPALENLNKELAPPAYDESAKRAGRIEKACAAHHRRPAPAVQAQLPGKHATPFTLKPGNAKVAKEMK